ncbi:MAG TPA: phosphatase PAP2 family protein [Anaeromyxobacteraceae bacterium]|nr:phosphatase PAP2 family protein [Anaeromyxobacteraceae bacterium]
MPRSPGGTLRREAIAVALLLAGATAVFWTTRLDLAAADAFREGCCSWPLAERPPWSAVYRYGVFAGVLLAAAALGAYTLSYWYPRALLGWRRPALFLVLVVALGPGLLVNVAFKDHYGRPRPREVQELGGREPFLPVWVKGDDAQAKSFPCGHCSMGFYLSTPYLVLRRRRRKTAAAFLLAGVGWGALLGVARMMAGGHFLSDVVWSGGMVWIVALALYRLLDLDRVPEPAAPEVLARDRRRARLVTVLGGGALALLTAGALVATPYVSSKTFSRTAAQVAASGAAAWEVSVDEGTVTLDAGRDFEASYQVRAFGFPTSHLQWSWREGADAAVLSIDRLGWFTERRTEVKLHVPRDGSKPLRLRVGKGRLDLDLRGFAPGARLEVRLGEGEVRVVGASALASGNLDVRVEHGRLVEERG